MWLKRPDQVLLEHHFRAVLPHLSTISEEFSVNACGVKFFYNLCNTLVLGRVCFNQGQNQSMFVLPFLCLNTFQFDKNSTPVNTC